MLKAFHLGIVFAVVVALFAFILARPLHFDIVLPRNSEFEAFLADEGTVRSERSANISHIIGLSRKIHLVINRMMFLTILPNGTVYGTDSDNEYTILQRGSINHSQIKIQGVVTCNFLCMDHCGLLYGSKEFTDECIFNEVIEAHNYNTYSSAKYSNDKRTLYLALNKKGMPRKVQAKAGVPLGRRQIYTNVLPKPVPDEKVKAIIKAQEESRSASHHLFRHHRYQFCPSVPLTKLGNKSRCRSREKRKKKRKCKEDENEDDDCTPLTKKLDEEEEELKKRVDKCEEDEDEEECQKRLHTVRQKRKSRNGEPDLSVKVADKKRKRRLKSEKKKFSEKTLKLKKKGGSNGKIQKKEKTRTPGGAASLLWEDSIGGHPANEASERLTPSTSTDSTTYDYEEEEDEDTSTEVTYDWTTASNRD